jgi:hypothetical protein
MTWEGWGPRGQESLGRYGATKVFALTGGVS